MHVLYACFGCAREESPGCAIIMQSINIEGCLLYIGKGHNEIEVS